MERCQRHCRPACLPAVAGMHLLLLLLLLLELPFRTWLVCLPAARIAWLHCIAYELLLAAACLHSLRLMPVPAPTAHLPVLPVLPVLQGSVLTIEPSAALDCSDCVKEQPGAGGAMVGGAVQGFAAWAGLGGAELGGGGQSFAGCGMRRVSVALGDCGPLVLASPAWQSKCRLPSPLPPWQPLA
jgi:hypothetical protein